MAAAAIALVIGALVLAQRLVYKYLWYKHIELRLNFSSASACEGDSLLLSEVITNRKLLPLPWLAVKFQLSRGLLFADMDNARVSDDFYRNDLFNILPYRRITRKLPFVCGKRGVYTVKSAELVSGDIFNGLKLSMSVPCAARLTVYPRLIELDEVPASNRQVLGQILARRLIQPDPFEFIGIREYQPYDSLRAVNFNATAKTGEWMVNVNGFTVTRETVLILNLAAYSPYPDESLYEQTIRLAASIAARYMETGTSVGIVTNGGGAGEEQAIGYADGIYGLLARIDLKRGAKISCAEMLAEAINDFEAYKRCGRQRSYILLSTDCGKAIADGFNELIEAGAEGLWLVPVRAGMEEGKGIPNAVITIL